MKIEVKNLSFSYGPRPVLHDINMEVDTGEFLSILGPNGVGKSTLFRCILGLLQDYEGSVLIDGIDARRLSEKELSKKIAYIPQHTVPSFNFSVEDIVLMGTTAGSNLLRKPRKEEYLKAESAMDKMGIIDMRERCFHHLSGGERQLAVIARALAQDARILMLDEPTAALDFGNQLKVLRQIKSLADEGYTVIQTTHNPEHAFMFSDKIIAIKDGRRLAYGTPEEIIIDETVSTLYGTQISVASFAEDSVRVCIPKPAK